MAILNFFKKNKEKERFLKKKGKAAVAQKTEILKIADKKNTERKKENFKDDVLVLESPYKTEKSVAGSEHGIYVFKINQKANKIMVRNAVEKMYNAHVEKVNILRKPPKKIFVKGKWGRKTGFKKAIVYLKKGENIEI